MQAYDSFESLLVRQKAKANEDISANENIPK
jgi:hypothetical protein